MSQSKLHDLRTLAKFLECDTPDHFCEIQQQYKQVPRRASSSFVQFLGTGQGTHCIAARGPMARSARSVSGPIFASEKSMIWIDPGPDALYWLDQLNIDARQIDALLLSHAHPDHYGNLVCAIEAITGATEIKGQKSIIGNKTSIDGAKDSPPLVPPYHRNVILKEAIAATEGGLYAVGDISIVALPSDHRETRYASQTLNWLVTIPIGGRKMRIVYFDGNVFEAIDGAPTDRVLTRVVEPASECDILIANVSNHVKVRSSAQNYVSTKGLLYLAEVTTASLVATTHFGIDMLWVSDKAESRLSKQGYRNIPQFQAAYVQAELDALGRSSPRVVAASDGLRVELAHHTIEIRSGMDSIDPIAW